MITLSDEQQNALGEVRAWLDAGGPDFFCLYGHAGTGKTSLALRIAEMVGDTAFVAYTGKAALALRAKGCRDATTIHRRIYRACLMLGGTVEFVLRQPEELNVALIIVDECSMVDERLVADLLSFGRPILAMGDPYQLPPIEGRSFFNAWRANVYLKDVHRQAAISPIVRASAILRRGYALDFCDDEGLKVISWADATADMFIHADQIIVGRNTTRLRMNRIMRWVRGFMEPYPVIGDRVVCLRSNYRRGLVNGSLWEVQAVDSEDEDEHLGLTLQSLDDFDRRPKRVRVLKDFFSRDPHEIDPDKRQRSDEFDYAYALTAHKAQGSQWSDVSVVDESGVCETPTRWMYTAITRAAEKATVVRGKRRVRREFARNSRKSILPGGEDLAVEKAILSTYFQCAIDGTIATLFEVVSSAAELLQLQEGRHSEAKRRVKEGLEKLDERGALSLPYGRLGVLMLNGQHLSPTLSGMVVERWKPVLMQVDTNDVGFGESAVRPRGRRPRGPQE